jgi:hypothetical protein
LILEYLKFTRYMKFTRYFKSINYLILKYMMFLKYLMVNIDVNVEFNHFNFRSKSTS